MSGRLGTSYWSFASSPRERLGVINSPRGVRSAWCLPVGTLFFFKLFFDTYILETYSNNMVSSDLRKMHSKKIVMAFIHNEALGAWSDLSSGPQLPKKILIKRNHLKVSYVYFRPSEPLTDVFYSSLFNFWLGALSCDLGSPILNSLGLFKTFNDGCGTNRVGHISLQEHKLSIYTMYFHSWNILISALVDLCHIIADMVHHLHQHSCGICGIKTIHRQSHICNGKWWPPALMRLPLEKAILSLQINLCDCVWAQAP